MNALAAAIEAGGGRIHLKAPVEKIRIEGGVVKGVDAGGRSFAADAVISTAPTPVVAKMLADAPADLRARYERIRNIACICVIHKLKRTVTGNFWVNVSDAGMAIPGIVEFSNLRPLPETIVYVPYYMPATNPKFGESDEALIAESWSYLKRINPALTDDDRIASRVGRLRHAQPIYEKNFPALLPPIQTPIKGLQIADTCFYYPEDRGVSESVRLAKKMVDALPEQSA
jgi:protoporphyrinogen oxidase